LAVTVSGGRARAGVGALAERGELWLHGRVAGARGGLGAYERGGVEQEDRWRDVGAGERCGSEVGGGER
jgi:hypothetical protein